MIELQKWGTYPRMLVSIKSIIIQVKKINPTLELEDIVSPGRRTESCPQKGESEGTVDPSTASFLLLRKLLRGSK